VRSLSAQLVLRHKSTERSTERLYLIQPLLNDGKLGFKNPMLEDQTSTEFN
jgi:hypothetical protein